MIAQELDTFLDGRENRWFCSIKRTYGYTPMTSDLNESHSGYELDRKRPESFWGNPDGAVVPSI